MDSFAKWLNIDVDYVNNLVAEVTGDTVLDPDTGEAGLDALSTGGEPLQGNGMTLTISGTKIIPVMQEGEEEYAVYMLTFSTAHTLQEHTVEVRFSEIASWHESLTRHFVGLPLFPAKTLLRSVSQRHLRVRRRQLHAYFRQLLLRIDVMHAAGLSTILQTDKKSLAPPRYQAPDDEGEEEEEEEGHTHVFDEEFVKESNQIVMMKKLQFPEGFAVSAVCELGDQALAVAVGDDSALAQVDSLLDVLLGNDDDVDDAQKEEPVEYGGLYIFVQESTGSYTRKCHMMFEQPVQFMQYDSERDWLYVATKDGCLHFLSFNRPSFTSFALIDTFHIYSEGFTALKFVAQTHLKKKDSKLNRSMLLSVSEGGLINGTDVKSGTSVFEYEYDTARIEALGYDAEAQRLFAGTFDRRIHIFSIEKCFLPLAATTTTSVAADSKHNANTTTAQISRPTDEPKIEYIVPDYTQAPTVKTGRRGGHFQPRFCHTLLGPEGSIRCLVYNEATQTLYGSSFDGAVYAWTIADQHREQYSELQYKLSVGAETLNTMALTEDASILVTGDATGTVLVWSLADKAVVFGFKAHLDTVNGVVLTNNGRIVTYSEDETMIMWRLDYQE